MRNASALHSSRRKSSIDGSPDGGPRLVATLSGSLRSSYAGTGRVFLHDKNHSWEARPVDLCIVTSTRSCWGLSVYATRISQRNHDHQDSTCSHYHMVLGSENEVEPRWNAFYRSHKWSFCERSALPVFMFSYVSLMSVLQAKLFSYAPVWHLGTRCH